MLDVIDQTHYVLELLSNLTLLKNIVKYTQIVLIKMLTRLSALITFKMMNYM